MKTKILLPALCLLLTLSVSAQELFPVAEPASNVPKGALGVRLLGEGYKEAGLFRSISGLRLMYGATPRLSVYATATFSDYHEKTLPFDFITHEHSGGVLVSNTNTPKQGVPYSYVFNTVYLYAKYRFISSDGVNTHFRMAGYAEGSYAALPSHITEPDLRVHSSGFSAGLITTYLKDHFAASVTTGFIIPSAYRGNTHDNFGGVYPTTIRYGNAVNYSLSLGYLLFPKHYTGYGQTNWNIYCEFIGKAYGAASVREQNGPFQGALVYDIPINTPILQAGNFVDVCPGVQCIINSIYRIDLSAAFPLVRRSYAHLYPLYMVGLQRYIFFNKHQSKKIR